MDNGGKNFTKEQEQALDESTRQMLGRTPAKGGVVNRSGNRKSRLLGRVSYQLTIGKSVSVSPPRGGRNLGPAKVVISHLPDEVQSLLQEQSSQT